MADTVSCLTHADCSILITLESLSSSSILFLNNTLREQRKIPGLNVIFAPAISTPKALASSTTLFNYRTIKHALSSKFNELK